MSRNYSKVLTVSRSNAKSGLASYSASNKNLEIAMPNEEKS